MEVSHSNGSTHSNLTVSHWSLTIITLFLFSLAMGLHLHKGSSIYSLLLMTPGLLCYLAAIFFMKHRSRLTSSIPVMLTILLSSVMVSWMLYSFSVWISFFSWVCLIMGVISTLFSLSLVTIKMYAFNNKENTILNKNWAKGIHETVSEIQYQIKDNRACYLFIALTLFLTTLYFTVFSFSFHDTNERKFGRYDIYRNQIDNPPIFLMKNISPQSNGNKKTTAKNGDTTAIAIKSPYRASQSDLSAKNNRPPSNRPILTLLHSESCDATIRFIKGRADILLYPSHFNELLHQLYNNTSKPDTDIPSDLDNVYFTDHGIPSNKKNDFILRIGSDIILGDLKKASESSSNTNPGKETAEEAVEQVEVSYINSHSLALIVSEILKNPDNHYIITVSGYTSAEIIQTMDMYQSNYELSESRAFRVREKILDLLMKNIFLSNNCLPSIEWIIMPKTYDCPECIGDNRSADEHKNLNKNSKNKVNDKICYKTEISIKRTISNPMKKFLTIYNNHQELNKSHKEIRKNISEIKKGTDMLKGLKLADEIDNINTNVSSIKTTTSNILSNYNTIESRINEINDLTQNIPSDIRRINAQLQDIGLKDIKCKISTMELINNPTDATNPHLLDYFHYTIYTITTTGYGDMIPFSSFAKFLTSLSNIFEIVFGLIFFNVILSRESQNL